MTIAGLPFQVTQDGLACSITLDTSGLGSPHASAGGEGTIEVTTNGAGCGWTASSAQTWASISPSSGSTNATLTVIVGENLDTAERSAALTIGGQTVILSQVGLTCSYALQSTTGSVPAGGASGSVGVITARNCGWSSSVNNPLLDTWLQITSSGTAGSTNVQFVASPNPAAASRVGSLTVAGLTYAISQAAAACSYTLDSTTSPLIANTGGSSSFGFSAAVPGCAPVAVSYAGWVSVSSSFGGTSGTVDYTVAANPASTTRTATIQVGDKLFSVIQTGTPCGYSFNAYGVLFNVAGGGGSLLASFTGTGCNPASPNTIGTTQPTIITLGTLTGPALNIFTQPYTVAPFSTLTGGIRIGQITFGGRFFTVKQTSW
jgi:hypothetical protein